MASTETKAGNLPITLATYIYLLDDSGRHPQDSVLQLACNALRDAPADKADELGAVLVAQVTDALGGRDASFDKVVRYLKRLFGDAHVATDMGGTREDRFAAARRYEFQMGMPWLAQIVDRFPDGAVGAHWVMVERTTDTVRCMDPYPWDDVDEEYEAPVVEFAVKWELAGANAVRWVS